MGRGEEALRAGRSGERRTTSTFASASTSKRSTAACLLAALVLLLPGRTASAAEPVVRHAGNGAAYAVRAPEGWDKKKGGLLVFGFHQKNGSHEKLVRQLAEIEELAQAVIAAPEAPDGIVWNNSDDLTYAGETLLDVQREYRPTRTIVVGFSLGSYFATMMGVRHADKIDGVVAHSGGLAPFPVPNPCGAALRRCAFFEIFGSADVNIAEQARKTVHALEAAGVWRVRIEEVEGLGHQWSKESVLRGIEWIQKILPPAARPLTEEEAEERLKALAAALKAKDVDQVEKAFAALAGAPEKVALKIAGQAKLLVTSQEERVALAAIEAASRTGDAGVPALEPVNKDSENLAMAAAAALVRTGPANQGALLTLLKAKSPRVAVAAAKALGDLGNRPSIDTLIRGLQAAEEAKMPDDRVNAANDALHAITGQDFTKAAEWRAWADQKPDKKK